MTPPWVTTTTRSSACAPATAAIPARTRSAERVDRLGAGDRVPALFLDGLHERGVALLPPSPAAARLPIRPGTPRAGSPRPSARDRAGARAAPPSRPCGAASSRRWRRCPRRRGGLPTRSRLLDADGVERRVAVPVDELERLLRVDGLGLAVAHEEDLGRARRRRVAVLAVGGLGLGHEPQDYGARPVGS